MSKSKNLFLLILIFVSCINFGHGQNHSYLGWYKTTESSNNDIWNIGLNFNITDSKTNDSLKNTLFTGFTNQGARVLASIENQKILIPKQTVSIIPYGGDGKQQWEVEISANGIIKSETIILNFSIKQENHPEYTGIIKAVKIHELSKKWNFCTSIDNGKYRTIERKFKREVKKRKKGVAYDNGPGSGMQISHNSDLDSLTQWFKNMDCVEDASWDKCQEKISIYPGWSIIGVKFKTKNGIEEKCFHIQEGTMGNIVFFKWKFHLFKYKNILVYKKMYNCDGFIEIQKKNCAEIN